ncbi:chromosome segregation protein SMC [Corynebacterium sp. 320]|uniref:chromosome segregation protein SMC n=1 Tax=Corynebacterium TaxID=1716 RepID=UPI00125CD0F2|nr:MULTISPECIES: chromosome segregation protein SMC [Corynebacterium]KAB1503837.1 chromosome segregation protein SMC [Corynebacterium sp. 320]KAB1553062.1 chromosome segregation protein SMC [Corynebacterium sp. 321]KAB1553717.1 chromosome segregation protein SMC [Corynebacterium sp. 319]KAB3527973.1 chromosome segregation protein SMC [Corynebacterium sp. 250]KAB3540537.1 chromosome segregation protein SMC [Corynebacterium sp. 366]
MYLKSLTLKGFKSFAQPTTLKLEPGICAVVGPNGSGKSNVVDALAWVMGEHSAKTLRGGKMEDVIFAGAGERKALGRAEVTLTIDNSDGQLPIEYSEVSVTRRMFRDGASEYEINGTKSRLMDIQELLSDTGIGREMHVIVGQGRLAQILESRPEERRAFIEEAAGVLKHRRRKEKAQRKLVNMQANLDRLHDLTDELHKQLGPLARQAEAAKKASTVQATIRTARVQLAAHQVTQLSASLEDTTQRAQQLNEQLEELQQTVEVHSEELAITEEELRTALEEAESAKNLWYRLSAVSEKNAATVRIAADRAESTADAVWTGPDPDEILARAEAAELEQQALDEAVEMAQESLESIRESVLEAEDAAREAEREHLAQARAIADRREGVVRLLAQHEAATARVDNARTQLERAAESVEHFKEMLDSMDDERAQARDAVEEASGDFSGLEEDTARAEREAAGAEERSEALRAQQLQLEKDIAHGQATLAAWRERLRPSDGAAVAVEAAEKAGVSARSIADAVAAQSGWGAALASALGAASDAGVIAPLEDSIVTTLEDANAGRAVLMEPRADKNTWRLDLTPAAGQWLLDLIDCPEELQHALTSVLVDVVAVESGDEARRVVEQDSRLRAVTRTGTLYGSGWVAAGTGGASNAVEIAENIAQLEAEVERTRYTLDDLQGQLRGALDAANDLRTTAASARAKVQEQRAARVAVEQHYAAVEKQYTAAESQWQRAAQQRDAAEQALNAAEEELAELNDRVSRVEDDDHPEVASTAERDAAAQALTQVRSMETEARLALRTAEERAEATRGRADALRRQARHEQQSREQFERSQQRKAAVRVMAQAVHTQARRVEQRIAAALLNAEAQRSTTEQTLKQWQAALAQQKDKLSALQAQLGRVNNAAHEAELARTQAQVKLEQALNHAMEQLAMNAEQLLSEQLPDDFDATETRAELKKAEKSLNSLGKVNPLALEEYKALEERFTFLSQQLDDVEQARKDLQDVIQDVDDTILHLFTDAWKDVEAEFPRVFQTLFPGGQGRLVLTEPDDMLTTGIEVEARPPGKKVKRLSLLSGGEKSLTALAMLVAIFRARPSPFYVMDEVEAALDDVNLRRLIALFEELRKDSQLIVITHQKPTMDVANVLYGVTMRGDGVTRVISQRMSRSNT